MPVDIKFCGLTRPEDADRAVRLGATYTGVIFAGGLRRLTVDRAVSVLATVPPTVQRVGVFSDQSDDEVLRTADQLALKVLQLHAASTPDRITRIKERFDGDVWAVIRVEGGALALATAEILVVADGLLLDAFVPGTLGGTGVTIPWAELAIALAPVRGRTRIVLAGGLRPENVADAIRAMRPDVVDVSSGVESAPGIKDQGRMRAFCDAVREASIPS